MAVEVGPIKCLRPPIGKPRPARAGAVSLGPTHSWLCSGLGFHPTDRGRVPTPDLAFLSPAGSMDRSGVPLDGLRLELGTSKFRVLHMLNTDSKYSFSIYGNSLTSIEGSYHFGFFYFIFVSVGIPRSTEKRDGLERAHVPELGADGAPP
jgi:hypothetical protein